MKSLKIILFTVAFTGLLLTSFADRGVGKRTVKTTFNIKMPTTFKSSLKFNLRNGLKYNGTLLAPVKSSIVKSTSNLFVTYQKGNSVYIVPYKQKLIMPEYKLGYVGAKLVIKINR